MQKHETLVSINLKFIPEREREREREDAGRRRRRRILEMLAGHGQRSRTCDM